MYSVIVKKYLPVSFSTSSTDKTAVKRKKLATRKFYSYARVVHIYLSMSLLSLMILFCFTGIVLNHTDWLSDGNTDGDKEIILPQTLKGKLGNQHAFVNPPINEIQQLIKSRFGLAKPSDISMDEAANEIIIDYKLPAGYATAIVDVTSQSLYLQYRKGNMLNIMSDRHKGRHSGKAWSWVIDISAVLMIVFSLTGMIILLQNKKHRWQASLFALIGVLTPLFIYLVMVPRLTGV